MSAISDLILLAGTLNYVGKKYPQLTGEGRLQPGEHDEMDPVQEEITGHMDVSHIRSDSSGRYVELCWQEVSTVNGRGTIAARRTRRDGPGARGDHWPHGCQPYQI